MNRGRNISHENLNEIFRFLSEFDPKDEVEERNKYILELAFIKDMSSLQIANLHDPRIISFGNRAKGECLSHVHISKIIKSYNLVHEKRVDYTKRNNYGRRKDLTNKKQKAQINKPYICGCCGGKKNLELHHIVPMSCGGTDDYFNLIYLCHDCHTKIHKTILEAFKAVDAL